MTGHCKAFAAKKATTGGCASVLLALLLAGTAAAQEATEPAQPPVDRPGIFDVIERWVEGTHQAIEGAAKGTQQAIEGAAKDAAKAGQAGGAMLGFPGSKVAQG